MKFLYTIFLSLTSIHIYSCSCWGPSDFCSIISDTLYSQDYVIMGEKLSDVHHGMEVKVLSVYGKQFEIDTIMVWGDVGWLCRRYTGGFTIGDTLFLNLFKLRSGTTNPYEQVGDYVLSVCGRHDLSVKDGFVSGYINNSDAIQKIDVETLDAFLTNDDCSSLETFVQKMEVTIGPNPFFNELGISSSHRISSLEIFDMSGRLISTHNTHRFYYNFDSYDLNITPGLYLLRITAHTREEKVIRIVKE